MQLNGLMNVFYQAGVWVIRLVYLNILWLLFTVLGLVVFGVMPATVSLFAILRQWINGNEDFAVFPAFWQYFRQEFIRSNLCGLILLVIGFVLRVDIIFLKESSHIVFQLLLGITLCLGVLYFVVLLYFFSVYVHFNVSIFQYFKYALIIGLSQLPITIMMVLGGVAVFCLYWFFSGLIPLLCVSLFGLNLMWFGYRAFKNIEYAQQQTDTAERMERA
ncbi:YesL family protein [Gracilibacillus alcaliphilus]|uniref:YesL family protein n=1 Tax=Gracilibacillus alcaliphilus TaxID=1401441 RepID=UPI001956F17C|nr:YesL family protein [Gracilibacillus alcaliphilus]MBM7678683.1 putative membrane protein YesL [Gracilibacillus alcaliphilus]